MADSEDRTQPASSRRLQTARDEGNVPISRELAPLAVLSAFALLVTTDGPVIARRLIGQLAIFLEQAHRIDPIVALRHAGAIAAIAVAPMALAAAFAGAGVTLLQTRFLLNFSALVPNLSRLDLRRGLRRIFSTTVLLEAGKSVLKIAVVAWAGTRALQSALPDLPMAVDWDPPQLTAQLTQQILRVLFTMLAAQAVIATLDVVRAWLQHARSLRMSREELRDEHNETEGNPRIKARIRQIRLQRSRKRMMAAVPKATVVLTNPTHFAVALAYERAGGGAPRVVAKGIDEVAARIRDLATRHNVPLVANPPLARALYHVELDREIPAEHYKLVAEIIAYVWRLRGQLRDARSPRPAVGRSAVGG